jgi:hypothetical protein
LGASYKKALTQFNSAIPARVHGCVSYAAQPNGETKMPFNNKRSEEAKLRREQRRKTKKSIRTQASRYINENCFKDVGNGENVNLLTPENVKEYLMRINDGEELKVIRSALYGSIVSAREGFLIQAAQGLILEGTIKY